MKPSDLCHDNALSLPQLVENGAPLITYQEPENPLNIELRQLQIDSRVAVAEKYVSGIKAVIVSMPTGTGKTIFASDAIMRGFIKKNKERHIIFAVHLKELIYQAREDIQDVLGIKVGVIQAGVKLNLECQVQVASLDTLSRRFNHKDSAVESIFRGLDIGLLIVDECHRSHKATKQIFKRIKKGNDNYLIMGLTATPYSHFLYDLYGSKSLIKKSTLREQVASGSIVDYQLKCCNPIDMTAAEKTAIGEYKDADCIEAMEKFFILGKPAEDWYEDKNTSMKYTLLFAKNIITAEIIEEHFKEWARETGLLDETRIAVVHSKKNNSKIMADIKSGHVLICISVGKLSTGFNATWFGVMIDMQQLAAHEFKRGQVNSPISYIQRSGRVVRSDKGGCEAIDKETGKYYFIPKGKKVSSNLTVTRKIPEKEVAYITSYCGLDRFITTYETDELYLKLQKPMTQEEKKATKKEELNKLLDMIDAGDAEGVAGNISQECQSCGDHTSDAICPNCGNELLYIDSGVEGLDIEFVEGEMKITRIPEEYIKLIEKKKEQDIIAYKMENPDLLRLLPEQKPLLIAGIIHNRSLVNNDYHDKREALNAFHEAVGGQKREQKRIADQWYYSTLNKRYAKAQRILVDADAMANDGDYSLFNIINDLYELIDRG